MSKPKAVLIALAVGLLTAGPSQALMTVLSSEELRERAARDADPVLDVSPRALSATVERGETVTLRLTISNAGGKKLRWRLRTTMAGMRFTVSEGELGYRGSQLIDLTLPIAAAPGETVRGAVIVEAPGARGSPAEASVSVFVKQPAEEPAEPPERDAEPREPPERAPREASRNRFGLHVGYAGPLGGQHEDYLGGPVAGLHYRAGEQDASVALEIGLDFVFSRSEAGDAASTILMAGAAALFRMGSGRAFYLLGGGRLVSEWVDVDVPDAGGMAGTVDLGGGITFAGGRMDLRATYSLLVGSRNVPGFGGVVVGYSF